MEITKSIENDLTLLTMENELVSVVIVPELGGKIISIRNKSMAREFLWTNENLPLVKNMAGADYDSNFKGGIDELLPNDVPENIDGIDYPDHGELWTTPLQYEISSGGIRVYGNLPLSGLYYSKKITLSKLEPGIILNYMIKNVAKAKRHFLWKLHAALKITNGDKLVSTAATAQVVDPGYSRFPSSTEPFAWPMVENTDAAVVPLKNNTVDFFYLFNTERGEMQMEFAGNDDEDAALFSYHYDKKVFPYEWYFASYGGFLDHFTAVLEPCTNMPMQVNDAIKHDQSAVLRPGESIETTVQVFAGLKKNYISE